MKGDMKIVAMELVPYREDNLRITLKTGEGSFQFIFGKKQARQLMRAIFLQIGIDPRYGAGKDTLPDFARNHNENEDV